MRSATKLKRKHASRVAFALTAPQLRQTVSFNARRVPQRRCLTHVADQLPARLVPRLAGIEASFAVQARRNVHPDYEVASIEAKRRVLLNVVKQHAIFAAA
jgi:hypothetical protein